MLFYRIKSDLDGWKYYIKERYERASNSDIIVPINRTNLGDFSRQRVPLKKRKWNSSLEFFESETS